MKLKNWKRGLLCILSLSILMFNIPISFAQAETLSNQYDEYLQKTGMPQDIINSLDEELKETIYLSSNNADKEFVSVETKEVSLKGNEGGIEPSYIPPSDMSITVVAFKESSKYQGYDQYSIYPTFEWHKETQIGNDKFGFSLPSGWEVVPGKRNLSLYYDNPYLAGIKWELGCQISNPCTATVTGYGFDGFDTYAKRSIQCKGNAYFYAYKKDSSASHSLKLGYYHDTSSNMSGSFGISIGPFSVSLSGSWDNVEAWEDFLSF